VAEGGCFHHTSRKSGARGCVNTIRVTPNHYFYINGNYSPIGCAKPGDELATYEYEPSESVKHLIYSGLLGTGH